MSLNGDTSDPPVAAGYFVMVPTLSVGVHHIAAKASIAAFGLAVDTELVITVEPRGGFTVHSTAGKSVGQPW